MNVNSRIVSTADGREIRIVEAGQPDGVPVLVHAGTPGSSLLYHAWIEDAQSRGIRLIGYDRPGYGGSTARPGRTVAGAAEDVAAIARALDLDRLSVWGMSGGGPHALACAALLPDRVMASAVLASPAPYPADGLDWFAGMGADNITEFQAALEGREALEQFVDAAAAGLMAADSETLVQAFRSLLGPADVAVLTEEVAGYFLDQIQEGIKDSGHGWIDDDLAFTSPWGFDLSQIQRPVLLMHGEQDRFVPFAHGQWLARQIAHVEARLSPDDGHLTLSIQRIPEVHVWLLSQMQ